MNPEIGFGAIPRPKDSRDFKLGAYQPHVDRPAVFMPDISSVPVKMQGKYGTCGAHAGSMTDSILQTNKRGSPQDLSPKYLWKQIKLIDGFALDVGTDMRSIFKSLQNTGDCTEASMPNTFGTSLTDYSNPAAITSSEAHEAYQNDIGNYAFVDRPSMEQIKQSIYQNKAVIALVDCGTGWYTPSWQEADILPLKLGQKVGGHFVVLYGYDEKYIYFRNSWSTAWGRNGDGYFDESYLPSVWELGTTIVLPAPFIFTKNLYYGLSGDNDVVQLQKRLNVSQTGNFRALTMAAVMAYQKANGITPTGLVGPLTRAKLNTTQ